MKKSSYVTAIMLVQQLDDEYWSLWEDLSTIETARQGDCLPMLKEVIRSLENDNVLVEEAYGIIHDKDTHSEWDPEQEEYSEKLKEKHIHFLFKFEKSVSIQKLAVVIGVKSQYLEKLKSGRYGYDNCLAYLIHAKDLSKYQYPPEEVVTVLGEDYLSIYNRRIESWIKGRAKKEAQETSQSVDWVISEILTGRITKPQLVLTDELYKVYGQYKRRINEAFETFGEQKSYRAIEDLEAGRFKKTTFFIFGESGTGKTSFGKKLINLLRNISENYNESWDFCLTASTNAFDEYNGQEILFLDDIRAMSLNVSDWLKLLDPYTISPISARYHNRMGSAKLIIITSTLDPHQFFGQIVHVPLEDLGQFFRRIDCLVEVTDDFLLSVPEKQPESPVPDGSENTEHSKKIYTFDFSKPMKCSLDEAKNRLIKTIIKNMRWHKKGTSASDQTNTHTQPNKDN